MRWSAPSASIESTAPDVSPGELDSDDNFVRSLEGLLKQNSLGKGLDLAECGWLTRYMTSKNAGMYRVFKRQILHFIEPGFRTRREDLPFQPGPTLPLISTPMPLKGSLF
jgi:hypothetical protein